MYTVLVLEVNHQYSYSKILTASTGYSYAKVEYSTPSLSKELKTSFTFYKERENAC